jgi:hypothetical protein
MNQENTTTLTIQDIKNVLVLIDLCTQRGSFRGGELASVGQLYQNLEKFVEYAEQHQLSEIQGV